MKCEIVTDMAELKKVFAIRLEVFVKEQGVAVSDELDENEYESQHILIYHDGKACGTGRLRETDGMGKLERICVLKDYRKYGVGRAVVENLEQIASARGIFSLKLHGQTQAAEFYRRLGYRSEGDEFIEDGIAHFLFLKELSND